MSRRGGKVWGDGLRMASTLCSLLCPGLCSVLLCFKPMSLGSSDSWRRLQGKGAEGDK